MKEKIEKILDRLFKRKVYVIYEAYFDPATSSFNGVGEAWGGLYGGKKAAEKEIHDRGYKKKNVVVREHSQWKTKPYWKEIYVDKSSLGDFYAVIIEESLKW